jgi:hypothetical protein
MISLDLAGLILVASRTLDLGQGTVLDLADIGAAESVLAEVRSGGGRGPEEAAARLLHGLVRRRVFGPRSAEVGLVAALQLLALNGRDAGDLGTAEQVRELIAGIPTGEVGVAELTAWLQCRPQQAAAGSKGRPLPWRIAARSRMEGRMFERFTERAREVVTVAQEEARGLGHNYIGTEHILLGLLREGDGVAAEVLRERGITLAGARAEVERIIGRGTAAPAGRIPFTPRSKKVLELSLREAKRLRHSYIGTEHILLGLLREGDGVAAEVLAGAGANLGRLRESVIQLVRFTGGSGEPSKEHVLGEVAAVFDDLERLRAEVARLRALLREHGIEPDGGASRSA